MPFDSAEAPLGLRLLDFFGENGERWTQNAIQVGAARCLIGGILEVNGAVCAWTGEAYDACLVDVTRLAAFLDARDALGFDRAVVPYENIAWGIVSTWNDARGRTWDEVRQVCLEFV